MTETVMIEIEAPVLREIDAIARQRGISREGLVRSLVERAMSEQREQLARVELGLAQLDRGEGVSQDAMEDLAARYRLVS